MGRQQTSSNQQSVELCVKYVPAPQVQTAPVQGEHSMWWTNNSLNVAPG